MGANIYYRPLNVKYDVPAMAPSAFIDALGGLPCRLSHDDLSILRAQAQVGFEKEFRELIEAIEKFGSIEVWAEY